MPGKLHFPEGHVHVAEYSMKMVAARFMLFWHYEVTGVGSGIMSDVFEKFRHAIYYFIIIE